MIRDYKRRLEKIERVFGGGKHLIVCTVRDGHKDEDLAQAKAAAGATPDDFVVIIRTFLDRPADEPFEPLISILPCS